MTTAGETPWHANFPPPRNQDPAAISRETLLQEMKSGKAPASDVVLVDLRKVDYEGGTIQGSLNLPAQSLYPSLPSLYELCRSAKVKKVVFYCGSSGGRGTRAAGWFDDLLSDKGVKDMQSLKLEGGIKGWANAGDEYTALMEGYDPGHWGQFKA